MNDNGTAYGKGDRQLLNRSEASVCSEVIVQTSYRTWSDTPFGDPLFSPRLLIKPQSRTPSGIPSEQPAGPPPPPIRIVAIIIEGLISGMGVWWCPATGLPSFPSLLPVELFIRSTRLGVCVGFR